MTTVHQLKRQARDQPLGGSAATVGGMVAPGAVLVFALASIGGLAISMSSFSYDVWAAFWIAPVLMLLCVPIANHAARAENDPKVGRFILGVAFLKIIIGTSARFGTLEVAYDGGGDSERYHEAGIELAKQFRMGNYEDLGKISGTRFIELLTGQIYAITGATEFGGFLIYSFLAFVGMCGFYRAFCIAYPEGDRRRYRILLFLFPTMWFWPSSTGKDAWMIFALGIATYGFAKVLDGHLGGLLLATGALWGAAVVRPHLAAIFVVASAAALSVRFFGKSARDRVQGRFGGTTALVFLVVLVGAAVIVSAQVQERFQLDELNVESAESVLGETTRRTSQGGSEFDAPSPATPTGYAKAFVTVTLRPFPFEARNPQSMATALEGVAIVVLSYLSLSRLLRLPLAMLRTAYVAFALTYVFTFVYAFASIENFGILARQRAQLLPLLFMLLALTVTSSTDEASVTDQELASV